MSNSVDQIQTVKVPKPVPLTTTRFRPPKKNIPQTKADRDALLAGLGAAAIAFAAASVLRPRA